MKSKLSRFLAMDVVIERMWRGCGNGARGRGRGRMNKENM
jgi:hypothetical protein